MTSAFIDHFGFNDEEFGEQEENVKLVLGLFSFFLSELHKSIGFFPTPPFLFVLCFLAEDKPCLPVGMIGQHGECLHTMGRKHACMKSSEPELLVGDVVILQMGFQLLGLTE